MIDEPRDIAMTSSINSIIGLSFDQSTNVVYISINIVYVAAIFFSIPVKSIGGLTSVQPLPNFLSEKDKSYVLVSPLVCFLLIQNLSNVFTNKCATKYMFTSS